MSRLAVATARRVARAKHSRRQPVMKKPTFGCPAANRPHPLRPLPRQRRRRRRQRARRQRHPHPSMPRGGTRLPRLHWRRRPTGGESVIGSGYNSLVPGVHAVAARYAQAGTTAGLWGRAVPRSSSSTEPAPANAQPPGTPPGSQAIRARCSRRPARRHPPSATSSAPLGSAAGSAG